MNFAALLDFCTRMIPSAKQHALAWRMRRETLRAHSREIPASSAFRAAAAFLRASITCRQLSEPR